MILGLAIVLSVGLSTSQPVNVTDSSGLDFDLAGGEERGFWVEFVTGDGFAEDSVVEARLTVSNDVIEISEGEQRVTGEEFSLSSPDESLVDTCSVSEGGVNYSVHTCQFDESELDEENNVSFTLSSDPRLMPSEYGFEFDLRSNASAEVVEAEEVEIEDGEANVSLDAGGSDVELNISSDSSEDSNVTVESYSSMPVDEPEDDPVVVSAVSVNTSDDEARGNITFTHSPGLADVDVYLLDGGEWTDEGIEVVDRGPDFVKAEVPHFSTYAAYGTDPDYDDTQEEPDTEESAISPVASPSGPDSSEDTSNQDSSDTDEDADDGARDDSQQDQDQTTQETDESGQEQQETSEEPATDTPSGLFTAEPSSIAGIAVFLVLVAAALLQYTGRVDFRKFSERIRG